MPSEAIILAGGLGTRLRPVVSDLPKCMAPVAGNPFLYYVINYLQQQGIDSFIFSTGYLSQAIEDFLEKQYPHLNYQLCIEEEPLGTGGAIYLACKKATTDHVFALNGDTLFCANLPAINTFHIEKNAQCTLALKPMKDFDRYGAVEMDGNNCIQRFQEKKYYKQGLINGGIYLIHRTRFLSREMPQKFSFEKDYLEAFANEHNLFGIEQNEYFIDIGIPEDFTRAQTELAFLHKI